MKMTVPIEYTCEICHLTRATVHVPARESEEILDWTKTMIQVLQDDHAKRSPYCQADQFKEVRIPVTGADKIGGPVVQ